MPIQINGNDKVRIKHLITEGVRVKQEVQDLNEGLRETVKAIAEELEIKPAVLNKAITASFKGDYHDRVDELDIIESILHAAGEDI
jgi:Fe-S cluster assembly ATPase SufC